MRKGSYHGSLYNYPKNFDEDGYLSPMEIQAKVRYDLYKKKGNIRTSLFFNQYL